MADQGLPDTLSHPGYCVRQDSWASLKATVGTPAVPPPCCDPTNSADLRQCYAAAATLSCARASAVGSAWYATCRSSDDCEVGSTCLHPVLPASGDTAGLIVRLAVRRCGAAADTPPAFIMFAGTAAEVVEAMELGSYQPRALPSLLLGRFSVRLPAMLALLLRITVAISTTMALFNAAPVPVTDGAHILEALLLWLAACVHGGATTSRQPGAGDDCETDHRAPHSWAEAHLDADSRAKLMVWKWRILVVGSTLLGGVLCVGVVGTLWRALGASAGA